MPFHRQTSQANKKSTEQFLNFANSHLSVRMALTADIDLHKEHFAVPTQAKQKSHLPYVEAWPPGL
jgi:hypothetical protein